MFWKLHKVGGTTLRHVLLRRMREENLTLGVLGCEGHREPLRAHLSASHVVCPHPHRWASASLVDPARSLAEAFRTAEITCLLRSWALATPRRVPQPSSLDGQPAEPLLRAASLRERPG